MYLDTESPILAGILRRQARKAAAYAENARIRFKYLDLGDYLLIAEAVLRI